MSKNLEIVMDCVTKATFLPYFTRRQTVMDRRHWNIRKGMRWKLASERAISPPLCIHVQFQVRQLNDGHLTSERNFVCLQFEVESINHIHEILWIPNFEIGAGLSIVTYLNSSSCTGTNRSDVYPLGGCASTPNGKAWSFSIIHLLTYMFY